MQDITRCPICQNKLKNRNFNETTQRTCADSIGHFFSITLEEKKVILLILYLDDYTSLEIDFQEGNSLYYYDPKNSHNKLIIPKILEPDFPKLEKLKEKLAVYNLFT